MKKSKYNHIAEIEGRHILYNCLSDEAAVLDPRIEELYIGNESDGIKRMHPEFHAFLQQKGFLVDSDINEVQRCIDTWKESDNDPTTFSITVNPTLDCNMRCWYCYEKHEEARTMTPEIIERLKKLLFSKISIEDLKVLNLSFFGGEPLMQFKSVVQPLVEYSLCQCRERNKGLTLGFTTNGYLLSGKIVEYLNFTNCHINYQITLDGNRRKHDQTRHTIVGGGSYDVIMANLAELLKNKNASVTLRLNYTSQNLESFIDVADHLGEVLKEPCGSLHIDIQRVWQDAEKNKNEDLSSILARVRKVFADKGFSVSGDPSVVKYRCYADRNNHVVVNWDGNIFHCTARDFTQERAEGYLTEDGIVCKNEKANLRETLKWGNAACLNCNIYPLCHGKCSQTKLESKGNKGCVMGMSEEAKYALITKRIISLINRRES